jgi:ATP-dependent DNA helicase PIF1
MKKNGSLYADQRAAFDAVFNAVQQQSGQLFFVDGPGGSGKTFLYNQLCAALRLDGKIVLCVASSGIAAILLPGGRTAHSRFKIPFHLTENSVCAITKQSIQGRFLQLVDLIIWDEAPMHIRFGFEAVDRLFRDLTGVDLPFGKKVFACGGDFRQTLPIIPRGSRALICASTLKGSYLWAHFLTLTLEVNMRLRGAGQATIAFAQFLKTIGDGKEIPHGIVTIPEDLLLPPHSHHISGLIDRIYSQPQLTAEYLSSRIILSLTNKMVDELNITISRKFPGATQSFYSADSVAEADNVNPNLYPPEFLATISPPGLPPSLLKLKIGLPVLLLRNLDSTNGLCNGTRMIIKRMSPRLLEVEIISGDGQHIGKRALIPRIPLLSSMPQMPFQLIRLQFPVKVAFAMTINKSQGQSMEHLGIYLPSNVFGHGQLYVAFSRAMDRSKIKVLIEPTAGSAEVIKTTRNLVYHEVL